MKSIIISLFFTLTVFLAGSTFAAEEEKAPVVSFSTKFFSKYVDDAGWLWSYKPVLQTELTLDVGKGFYVGMWHSTSIRNPGTTEDFGNENDPYIGWTGNIHSIDIDLCFTYIDIVPVFEYADGDTVEFSAKVAKTFDIAEKHTITPSVNVKYGFPVSNTEEEELDGVYVYVGLEHAWMLTEKFSVSQKGVLVIDTGAYGGDSGLLGSYEFKAAYAFIKWASLEISGKAIGPLTRINDGRKAHLIGSAGLVFSF